MDRSNFTAELCQHRNNTVAVPGSHVRISSRVLSIPRPIATPTPILLRH
ncbi:MAG: hypothetical protein ACOX52_04625 [Verrucomicrobiota bacterium]